MKEYLFLGNWHPEKFYRIQNEFVSIVLFDNMYYELLKSNQKMYPAVYDEHWKLFYEFISVCTYEIQNGPCTIIRDLKIGWK